LRGSPYAHSSARSGPDRAASDLFTLTRHLNQVGGPSEFWFTRGCTRRPMNKRKDLAYVQTNVYLPRAVKTAVKIELLKDETPLSNLVERLLRDWLKQRGLKVRSAPLNAGGVSRAPR